MLFGLSFGMLAFSVIVILVGIGIFMSESGIGAGLLFVALTILTFYADYISFSQLLIYMSIYTVLGIGWATFRLVKDTKKEFKKEITNNKGKELFDSANDNEENDYFRKEKYQQTDKEILSSIIENISFHMFSYRVFFMPIDMGDYIFTDLLKDLFEKIKEGIRGYLFRTILGKEERETL